MQKIPALLKIIICLIFSIVTSFIPLWAFLAHKEEQRVKIEQLTIHRNESIVPANLEFFEDDTNETISWRQCDYLKGKCDVEITSTGQLLKLDCGGHKCWLAE